MALSNLFERLGRAVFESPFGANQLAKEAPELAEIRLLAMDAIKEKSYRIGESNVFAFDLIRIHLLGIPEEQAAPFQSEFLASYFADELKQGLTRSSYRFPSHLTVEFTTSPKLPEAGESWVSVETAMAQPKPPAPVDRSQKPAILQVATGSANQSEFRLDKSRTNIGRGTDVYRDAGPSRRNDLAFMGDSEADRTVSREHAHIVRAERTNQYRIFNDRVYRGDENCGLWIVRDGLSQPVHHNLRGTRLEDGDEIHIGRAVVFFRLARDGDPSS